MKNKNSNGFTLIELMISVGISGVLASVAMIYMEQLNQGSQETQYQLVMQTLASQIEFELKKPKNLRSSADLSSLQGNKLLQNCLPSLGSGIVTGTPNAKTILCATSDPGNLQDFDFIKSLPKNAPPTAALLEENRLAGTLKNPARYSLREGKRCNFGTNSIPTSDCPIEVISYFWVTCPNSSDFLNQTNQQTQLNQTTCENAKTIHIKFQISYNPLPLIATRKHDPYRLKPIPSDQIFWQDASKKKPSSYQAISIPVESIPNSDYHKYSCPPNETMTGVVKEVPVCECRYPYTRETVSLTSLCISIPKKCAENERYRGTDEKGNVICAPVYCEERQAEKGCEGGGWAESVRLIDIGNTFQPQRRDSCFITPCMIGKNGGSCPTPVGAVECYLAFYCCWEIKPQ